MSNLDRVADGVYRLGTEWVGWYLCQSDGQVTVVDCGFPGYFEQLPRGLSELGLSLDAVAAIVLTHYHGDHVGAAERIRTETGAPVFAPAGDVDGVAGVAKVPTPGGMLASLWRPRMMRFIAHATANGGARQIPVSDVRGYDDGERLGVPGGLRAVHTPGHTGGHCSLLAADHGVLFAGDALTAASFLTGESGVRVHPFNEDAGRARESLENLEALPADVVVFGHGAPFVGAPAEAVAEARARLSSASSPLGTAAPARSREPGLRG
jgi:glyoxylase-like metal-dependent hydrolase (beta-lactamase superfamily II)